MRRIQAEGGTSAFSWVADPSSRLVVMATTRRYFFRHPAVTPFCEGVMRRTKRGWDPSFFWQFVNGTHGTTDCLKRVVPLVTPVFSTRLSPCCWRHSLPPFLLPMGHRTLIGRPHLFWRFPYCSQENFRRKLMERQKRGTRPLG